MIKILIVSDLHHMGSAKIKDKMLKANELNYDAILSLGDVTEEDFKYIKMYSKSNIYGVLGNHDDFHTLKSASVTNLHQNATSIDTFKIAGFEGSFYYKDGFYPSFDQEESLEEYEDIPKTDILISHAGTVELYPSTIGGHQGLMGIDKFILDNNIKLHFHGHIHKNLTNRLSNGSFSICCFGFNYFEINDDLEIVNRILL